MRRSEAIANTLQRFEQAWHDITTMDISMTVDEFEKKLRKLDARHGVTHSTEWCTAARNKLLDPATSRAERNYILSEVNPPELKNVEARLMRAGATLTLTYAEWAFDQVWDFVNDTTKDANLRLFVWNRLLPAVWAHNVTHDAVVSGVRVGFETGCEMPHVVMRPYMRPYETASTAA